MNAYASALVAYRRKWFRSVIVTERDLVLPEVWLMVHPLLQPFLTVSNRVPPDRWSLLFFHQS